MILMIGAARRSTHRLGPGGCREGTKILSTGQWASIKKLVAGQENSTIYWCVESWDRLKRYQKTGVMQFDVTE